MLIAMRHRDHHFYHHRERLDGIAHERVSKWGHHYHREHHPRISIGLFFIVLGAALLVATNDLLGFGSVSQYFTWETVLVFIGILMLLNLNFIGGLLFIAAGVWFLQDRIFVITPDLFRNIYWPAVIVLAGLGFILSSFLKRKHN